MRGPFFFLGGVIGASPLIHDGTGVESMDGAGVISVEVGFLRPSPFIVFSSLVPKLSSLEAI
jgi:hypothetical protein